MTRSSLTANVREAAELRAEDVATALASGATSTADLAVEDQEDAFIQVVDTTGQVTQFVDGFAKILHRLREHRANVRVGLGVESFFGELE